MDMKSAYVALLLVGALVCAGGCGQGDAGKAPGRGELPEDSELLSVIYGQVEAQNAEDLEGTLAACDENRPDYDSLKEATKGAFEAFDAKYTIEEAQVLEKSPETAKVRVVLCAERLDTDDAPRIRATAIHTLTKINGAWKISATENQEPEFLVESPKRKTAEPGSM